LQQFQVQTTPTMTTLVAVSFPTIPLVALASTMQARQQEIRKPLVMETMGIHPTLVMVTMGIPSDTGDGDDGDSSDTGDGDDGIHPTLVMVKMGFIRQMVMGKEVTMTIQSPMKTTLTLGMMMTTQTVFGSRRVWLEAWTCQGREGTCLEKAWTWQDTTCPEMGWTWQDTTCLEKEETFLVEMGETCPARHRRNPPGDIASESRPPRVH
jgi:hypothetical protein